MVLASPVSEAVGGRAGRKVGVTPKGLAREETADHLGRDLRTSTGWTARPCLTSP